MAMPDCASRQCGHVPTTPTQAFPSPLVAASGLAKLSRMRSAEACKATSLRREPLIRPDAARRSTFSRRGKMKSACIDLAANHAGGNSHERSCGTSPSQLVGAGGLAKRVRMKSAEAHNALRLRKEPLIHPSAARRPTFSNKGRRKILQQPCRHLPAGEICASDIAAPPLLPLWEKVGWRSEVA